MGQVRRQPNRRAHCDQVKRKKYNGSGEASAEPSCPLRPSKNNRYAPAGRRAAPYCFFPVWESYGGSAPKPPGKIKRFKPSLLSAFREQQGGKEKGEKEKGAGLFAPTPPTRISVGRNGVTARRYRFYKLPTLHLFASPSHCSWSLNPISLAHRNKTRHILGSYYFYSFCQGYRAMLPEICEICWALL